MRFLIVTGQSGAGKTSCVRFLEDMGCFCMDNLPPVILPRILEAFGENSVHQQIVAIGMDVRSGEFFDAHAVAEMINQLRSIGNRVDIIFMEAEHDCLLSRYKESRREHPLCSEGLSLLEAILEERVRLQPLREAANYVVDTTGLKTRDIAKILKNTLGNLSEDAPAMRAEVMSFGFKRGLPRQADLVLDVRFLPNPFYINELCQHSGQEECVRRYVMDHPATREFMQKWMDMLDFLLPHYREEGKHRLVVAVGCTGGMHRSVTIAEAIAEYLKSKNVPTEIVHRDLLLEQARYNSISEDKHL